MFVRGAITGVAIEGVIAALLTSVMILLFLGSWRSTVIIAVSIPLSVLGAIVMLSAIGETLNIMTLGGLALAVGILVDDATVTIENINWHLEQGKDVEPAIMDGAEQIVTPAFVSLLCICIVFVPMFFLDRRRALPVRADGRSGDVRDDLVVHPVAHAGADHGEISAASRTRRIEDGDAAAVAQSAGAIPARLRGALRAHPRRLPRTADAGDAAAAGVSWSASSASSRLRSCWCRFSGATSFPSVDAGSILMHVAHPGRHPRRGERQSVRRRAEGDPQDHPADRDRHAGRQHRHADLRHQPDLQQHRRDRPAGWRHPDQAEGRAPADRATMSRRCASSCRAPFPA